MGRVLDGHQGMGYIEIKTISNSRQLMDNLGFEGLLMLIASIEDCLGCLGRFSLHRRALMSAP